MYVWQFDIFHPWLVRVEACPWMWIFASVRIRTFTHRSLCACMCLCESLGACACQRACSHLYVCICTLKTLVSVLQRRCVVIYRWQSCRTDTVMTFDNSDTCTAVPRIKRGTHLWFSTTVCFYIQRRRFELCSKSVCVHILCQNTGCILFYHCINHPHSIAKQPINRI